MEKSLEFVKKEKYTKYCAKVSTHLIHLLIAFETLPRLKPCSAIEAAGLSKYSTRASKAIKKYTLLPKASLSKLGIKIRLFNSLRSLFLANLSNKYHINLVS